ncbi:MAG: DJ-1/PfpI family protein [Acidimicrobiia bacterium]|nr:DJ-1/PfpI family protein [Acidimicrobiia bacterium]
MVVPGGYAPDKLRLDEDAVRFVAQMNRQGKLIAAVCHAGSLLIDADVVDGRRVTSWPSIRTDLVNAGADWFDEEVVEDGNLITSRNPGDLDAFSAAIDAHLTRS